MSEHPCPDRLLLPEALSGLLDPAQERRVMTHLGTCVTCQEAADDIEIALVSLTMLRVEQDALPDLTAPSAQQLPGGLRVVSARQASGHSVLDLSAPGPGLMAVPSGGGVDEPAALPAAAVSTAGAAASTDELAQRRAGRRPVARTWIMAAAAAVLLFAIGTGVGHQILPPRDTVGYGQPLALTPPVGASDAAARGTVAVADEGKTIAVHLKASQLPAGAWFECLWLAGGQTRSAGSFRADNGKVDVDLRVAAPAGATKWDLQVIAHSGTTSQVVLQGSVT